MGNLAEERKEQWKAFMKQSLVQAVVKVLIGEGMPGLTMDRVAQEAGIAKGTLYNYFQDKEDLLKYAVKSSLEPLDQEVNKILGSGLPPEQKLLEFALRSMTYFDEHRQLFRVFLDPELSGPAMDPEGKNRHLELIAKMGLVFEEGVRSGLFKPVDPQKLGAMFVMACAAMMMGRMLAEDRAPVAEDARLLIDVFFRGIAA